MKSFLIIILLLNACLVYGQNKIYFGQDSPSNTPEIFAPKIISDQYGNRDIAISPAGDELFYTFQYRGLISAILYSRKINGKWTNPEVASFSGVCNDLEPAFSPDGTKLFFVSNRPLQEVKSESLEDGKTAGKKDYDVWCVTKENGKWQHAVNAGAPVNSAKDEFYPSVTTSGNIYFTRGVEGREEDILVCRFTDGKYAAAETLSDSVNSTFDEFNAFVSPDETFIVFSSYGRKDDLGGGDLYLSKNINGVWTNAVHLPSPINSTALDYCPYVSPDKKYFFFTSNRHNIKVPFDKQQTVSSLHSLLQNPLNGYNNIYWMKAEEVFGK